MTILDGKAIAKRVRAEIAEEVVALEGRPPCLATVLVGNDRDSASYVRMKHRACEKVGMRVVAHNLPDDVAQSDLDQLIAQLNGDATVDGILVQLPLPAQLDADRVIELVAPAKDVDGLGAHNIGLLAMRGRTAHFVPPTPAGVMVLLAETGVELRGKQAVVIGRSNLVGLPTALLLEEADATVTICHSHTEDLVGVVGSAEIVVVAAGQPNLITGDMLQSGCIVIDVGITYLDDPTAKRGYRIVGDVEFESASQVASYITPVPGGVGPLTIAMLLKNTLIARQRLEIGDLLC